MSKWPGPNNQHCQQQTESVKGHHNSSPFTSNKSDSSTGDIYGVNECCSNIGKLLINDPVQFVNRSYLDSQPKYHHQTHSDLEAAGSKGKFANGTMTIGHHHHHHHHHNHHYSNRHHYPYHDHYHDDLPVLPRIEFPSGQFDRLLRGSPNRSNHMESNNHSASSNRFTSSTRDTFTSSTSILPSSSSSSSSSTVSPFSVSNSRHSSSNSSFNSSLPSWKSGGPFENRKK